MEARMPTPLLVLLALCGLAAASLLLWRRARRRREQRLRDVLDVADAVQALLDTAGRRMDAWKGTVGRLAGDLGSGAQRALDGQPLVREAKRDLLQHRLWLQARGLSASPAELEAALSALQRVHGRLSAELAALEDAGAALTEATDAAQEAARREPPALRRQDGG
jgi:hypothetical protein